MCLGASLSGVIEFLALGAVFLAALWLVGQLLDRGADFLTADDDEAAEGDDLAAPFHPYVARNDARGYTECFLEDVPAIYEAPQTHLIQLRHAFDGGRIVGVVIYDKRPPET